MSEYSNVTQAAKQISRDENADTAETNFDKEYEMAQKEMNGSGTQSSLASPANIESADEAGDANDTSPIGESQASDRPGNPEKFAEMATELTSEEDE
ncbi:MAG: hypothetical protein AAFO87_13950 [Cyanobacteria bacterium J06607_6]